MCLNFETRGERERRKKTEKDSSLKWMMHLDYEKKNIKQIINETIRCSLENEDKRKLWKRETYRPSLKLLCVCLCFGCYFLFLFRFRYKVILLVRALRSSTKWRDLLKTATSVNGWFLSSFFSFFLRFISFSLQHCYFPLNIFRS